MKVSEIDGWQALRTKERQLAWAYLFFGVVVIAALVAGLGALTRSQHLAAVCYLSAAVAAAALLAMTSIVLVFRRRQTPHIERRHSGSFSVHTASSHSLSSALFYVLATTAATSATFGMATHRIDFDRSTQADRVIAWGVPAVAVLAAAVLVCFVLGLIRFPQIEASAQTLSIGGHQARQTAAWDDIEAIDAVLHRNNAGICLRLIDGTRADVDVFLPEPFGPRSSQPITVPIDVYAAGTLPLLRLLCFYLAHPEARGELDNEGAYKRLHAVSE